MVKFRLRRRRQSDHVINPYLSGNHATSKISPITWNECTYATFSTVMDISISTKIRFYFVQKALRIANNSFSAV